jgi:hypothetical protein
MLTIEGLLSITAHGLPNSLSIPQIAQVVHCLRVTFELAVHHRVQGLQFLIGAVDGLALRAAAVLKLDTDVQMYFHVFSRSGYYRCGGENVGIL